MPKSEGRMAKIASIAALAGRKAASLDDRDNRQGESPEERLPKQTLPKPRLAKDDSPKRNMPKSDSPKVDLGKRGNYTMVDNDIVDHLMTKLVPGEFVLYLYMYRQVYGYTGKYSTALKLSQAQTMNEVGITQPTATKWMNRLVELGLVEVLEPANRKHSTVYKVNLPSEVSGLLPEAVLHKISLAEDYFPKVSLPKEDLPKENEEINQKAFGSSTENALPKLTSGKPSEQDESNELDKPKDNKDIEKNNNMLSLLKSEGIRVKRAKVAEWVDRGVTVERLRKHIKVMKQNKERLENPTGWLVASIDEDWDVSDPKRSPLDGYQTADVYDYLNQPRDEDAVKRGLELVKQQNPWMGKG